MRRFSEAEKETIWDMREAGIPVKRIAKHLGRQNVSLRTYIADAGGKRPTARQRSELRLSLEEREEISSGLAVGDSIRAIAEALGRSPSTVCREINANGGPDEYRALVADRAACRRAKLARCRRSVGWSSASSRPSGRPSRSRRGWLRGIPIVRRCKCPTRPSTSHFSSRAVERCAKSFIRDCELVGPCPEPMPTPKEMSDRASSPTWSSSPSAPPR